MNLLTIDLEDWQPHADAWVGGVPTRERGRVDVQVDRIRRLLDTARVRATFFCLGSTAAAWPDVVKTLSQEGHEIASHGYSHLHTQLLEPEGFAHDIRRAQDILVSLTGQTPRGYRAPQFSITTRTWWALDILAAEGFLYDSSVFPVAHRRYGVMGFPRQVCRISTPHGNIFELPPATLRWLGVNVPIAGGGYFRLFPKYLLRRAVRELNRENLVFTTYFHPYEFDPMALRLSVRATNWRHWLRCRFFAGHQNLGRSSVANKLVAILRESEFGTCIEFLSRKGSDKDELLEYRSN